MEKTVNAPMDLRDRSLAFSRDIIRFLKTVPRNDLTAPIVNQLIRSATSIGANFTEAKNASSKRDFRNKVFIAKKEASETLYWLQLLEEFTDSTSLSNLHGECQEIILILQSIINKLGH
jgi:four helix bundle protein